MGTPPPAFFFGRRRSSVGLPPPPSTSHRVAPRQASACGDTEKPHGNYNTTSAFHVSPRMASENTPGSSLSNNVAAGGIAIRYASNLDEPGSAVGNGVSVLEVFHGRASETDQPEWDKFCGPPPGSDGSTWGWISYMFGQMWTWISDIDDIAAGYTSLPERNRIFYTGNVNYIFDSHNGHRLSIDNLHTVLNVYGVHEESIKHITKKIDPEMHGFFSINFHNKQILLTENTNFALRRDPLKTLRHASKCLQENLLSPPHFSGYIFDILTSYGYVDVGKPPFMLLGMYGILGVLSGPSHNRSLATRDVESFISIWRVLKPEEAEELKVHVIENYSGTISCFNFFTLLYSRNVFGKQRIQMFDTKKGPLDPSLYLFTLMHKNEHDYLFQHDFRIFATILNRTPSNEAVGRVIRKFDFDGDGKVTIEDIRRVMAPVLDGMTWEFWLVAIVFALKL